MVKGSSSSQGIDKTHRRIGDLPSEEDKVQRSVATDQQQQQQHARGRGTCHRYMIQARSNRLASNSNTLQEGVHATDTT